LEKRKRIKENILKMLDAGGMMQIESVKNNNHELYVLSKPEKDQNNRILWNYNYFEDDMWETASLDCKDLQIYSVPAPLQLNTQHNRYFTFPVGRTARSRQTLTHGWERT
jgi:hypothetical protein